MLNLLVRLKSAHGKNVKAEHKRQTYKCCDLLMRLVFYNSYITITAYEKKNIYT